jgi:hypothetical protein
MSLSIETKLNRFKKKNLELSSTWYLGDADNGRWGK